MPTTTDCIITAPTNPGDTGLVTNVERTAVMASNASQAKGGQTVIIASNNVDTSRGSGTVVGHATLGSAYCDTAAYSYSVGAANRYCEVGGQRSFLAGSLMSRIYGLGGITDSANRWDQANAMWPALYASAVPPKNSDNETVDQFYVGGVAIVGVDMKGGSGNFAGGCRGQTTGGDGNFSVQAPLFIQGQSCVALGAKGSGSIDGNSTAVVGSGTPNVASSTIYATMLGTEGCTISAGQKVSIVASTNSKIQPTNSPGVREEKAIVGCNSVTQQNGRCQVTAASSGSLHTGGYSALLGSLNGGSMEAYGFGLAYSLTANPAGQAPANLSRKFWLHGTTGDLFLYGAISNSGGDYAEMVENLTPGVIPAGTVLVRVGDRVRAGVAGDTAPIWGVVSARPTVVGNDHDEWQGRYELDEWGRSISVDIPMVRWGELTEREMVKVSEGNGEDQSGVAHIENETLVREGYDGRVDELDGRDIPEDAERYTLPDLVTVPEWDPRRPWVKRRDRPEEWTAAGWLGQIRTRITAPVEVDDHIGPDGAPVEEPTGIVVMKVLKPFDPAAGYGVAQCFVSVRANA